MPEPTGELWTMGQRELAVEQKIFSLWTDHSDLRVVARHTTEALVEVGGIRREAVVTAALVTLGTAGLGLVPAARWLYGKRTRRVHLRAAADGQVTERWLR